MNRPIIAIIFSLILSVTLRAACVGDGAGNIYIRAGAAGTATGADWTNACADLPSALARGSTYWVAASDSYGTHHFTGDSGTSTITIRRATVAAHGTDTGWNVSYDGHVTFGGTGGAAFLFDEGHIAINGQSNVTVSGNSLPGIKLSTDCASGPCGDVFFHAAATSDNVSLIYVDLPGLGYNVAGALTGIYGDISTGSVANLLVQYSYIHDFGCGGTPIQIQAFTSPTFDHNHIARNISRSTCHNEAIADTGSSGATITNNLFEDIQGTGQIVELNAGGAAATADSWKISGNVFWHKTPGGTMTNSPGAIDCINNNVCSNWVVEGNSFVNLSTSPGSYALIYFGEAAAGSSVNIINNLWWNSVNVQNNYGAYATGTEDYNTYESCLGSSPNSTTHIQIGSSDLFVASGSGNFHLATDTSAGNGTVLTATSPDPDGTARTSSRGAYQYLSNAIDSLSAATCNLGASQVGVLACSVILTNVGVGASTITVMTYPTGFSGSTSPASNCGGGLASAATCTLSFSSTRKGNSQSGTFTITDNAGSPSLGLTSTSVSSPVMGGASAITGTAKVQ